MGRAPERPSIEGLAGVHHRRVRAVRLGLVAIAGIAAAGTAGYMVLEGWSFGDSLYMVVITLSTVGFAETRALTAVGKQLTILLILTGVGSLGYVATAFSRLAIEGELRRVAGRRRMDKEIARLKDHFVVCGYGRVGHEVAENLIADGVAVLVIDRDGEALAELSDRGVPFLHGDAVDEHVLRMAGLDHARGLLLTLSHEADNVYVTLTARDLGPAGLTIVARSMTEAGERRLIAAGADRVVSPERIGARSMSNSVTRPTTVQFTDVIMARQNLEVELEELEISAQSRLVGRSIEECHIRRDFGVIVVGILEPEGEMVFNPPPSYQLQAGGTLIILGRREDLGRLVAAN